MKIDAHCHFTFEREEDVAALADCCRSLDLRLNNVCGGPSPRVRGLIGACRRMSESHPDLFAWGTTFARPTCARYYADALFEQLDEDFGAGAVSCKVWRDVGMGVKNQSGEYVLVDDPVFEPVFSHLAATGRPLVMHIGEPWCRWPSWPWPDWDPDFARRRVWGPLGDSYEKLDCPGFWHQVMAQVNVVKRHPDLRVIGAHLGCLDYDVGELAHLLERYPNFAVDTSARIANLACQNSRMVRQFFIEFQDQILWGTDAGSSIKVAEQEGRRQFHEVYETEFAYYETGDTITVHRGIETRGLALPAEVLHKIYHANALKWFPGLFAGH